MEKRLRSNEIGPNGCYFIRRLANNLGEPQRSYAINAIDRALTFWKAKRVRKPVPLRAPWLLGPNWTRDLRQLLTAHVHGTKHYNTTLQTPSTGIVFTKFPSVMDSLCNHKEAATKWADGENPKCACLALQQHATPSHQPDQHLVLDGDSLHFADAPSTSIATGSLQNKIFPPSKEIYTSLRSALRSWTTRNSLPSLPKTHWWTLATVHPLPLHRAPQPHHAQGHHTLQTALPGGHLSQWRQTSYILADLLPGDLFPMPHQDLRRPISISQIGRQPKWHHREDHRRDHQALWQVIPMGSWCWPWPTECLRPTKTQKTVPGWTTNR